VTPPPSHTPATPWRFCPSCGTRRQDTDLFCTECGTPVSATPSGEPAPAPGATHGKGSSPKPAPAAAGPGRAGWIAAAILLVVLIVAIAYPKLPGSGTAPAASAPMAGAQGGVPGVDLSSMTPREAADRLFNRVMRAVEQGDNAEARNFAPMAVSAYELAQPLDADGYFHLSLLQAVAFDFRAALATAEAALGEHPDHLLLLSAAAGAAEALADSALAATFYSRALEVFDAQAALTLPEYQEHAVLLPILKEEATAFLANAGG